MTDKRITQLTALTTLATNDLLAVVDVSDTTDSSAGTTKYITISNVMTLIGLNFETPTGTIDGSNAIFNVSNTPKVVILNGNIYFENDGYTLSGLTITMLVVPAIDSTLRSAH